MRSIVNAYMLVMRGTPLILQLLFVYFAPYYLFKTTPFSRFVAVVIAFVINYAAYFAEIYRGGVQAVPVGQREAAHVLGMTRLQAFVNILLPQVLKRIVLPISNEVITLVKDTALVTATSTPDPWRLPKHVRQLFRHGEASATG